MEELEKEKKEVISHLEATGKLKSPEIKRAMLTVKRELFVLPEYRKDAWLDTPLPIVGTSTISAPHMYAIMLEAVKLKPGEKVLEVGSGSGYGAALMKEIVGENGKVITVEIDREVAEFAKNNLKKAGYKDVKVVCGDGSKGYKKEAPYDAIIVTAAAPEIPKALIEQLKIGGRLISPVGGISGGQDLILIKKTEEGIKKENLGPVIFLPLRGRFGFKI